MNLFDLKELEANGFKIDTEKDEEVIVVSITSPDGVVSTGYSSWSYMLALERAMTKLRDGGDTF